MQKPVWTGINPTSQYFYLKFPSAGLGTLKNTNAAKVEATEAAEAEASSAENAEAENTEAVHTEAENAESTEAEATDAQVARNFKNQRSNFGDKFHPSILRNLTLAQPKGCQIDPQNVSVFVTRLEAQGPTGEWINF